MSDPTEAQDNVLEASQHSDSNSDSNSSSSDSSSDSSSSDEESSPGSPLPPVKHDQEEAGVNMDMSQDLDLSQDNNISDGWGLDDIQQFLANTIPQSGPVDPVFVDHQDSQHATNMDSLVFDPGMSEANTLHEMNEPRLESVCNSTINSAENSVIMDNDLEEDDLNDALGEVDDNPDQHSTSSHNKQGTSPKKNKKKRKQQSSIHDDSDSEQDFTVIAKMPPKKSKVETSDVNMTHSESPPLPNEDFNSSQHAIVKDNPPPPPPLEESPSKRSKKLSLKDYKAKKEAERLRASTDSESLSSKETSPSPAREQSKSQVDTEQSNIDEDSTSADLHNFDILDELDDADSENDEDSDSLAEDEIDQLLEANVKHPGRVALPDIEPESKLKKLVLEERGQNMFEVLPQGWVSVTHNSGIPLYLHRESRVVTVSKPYDLGNGSVRKHNIPISAIPCYAYKYYDMSHKQPPQADPPTVVPTAAPASCPYSSSTSFRENASPDSTTPVLESASEASSNPSMPSSSAPESNATESVPSEPPAYGSDKNQFPKAQIATIEESMKQSELTPAEVTKYCKKVFVFKELEIAKFRTWKERRAYLKQSHKKK